MVMRTLRRMTIRGGGDHTAACGGGGGGGGGGGDGSLACLGWTQ